MNIEEQVLRIEQVVKLQDLGFDVIKNSSAIVIIKMKINRSITLYGEVKMEDITIANLHANVVVDSSSYNISVVFVNKALIDLDLEKKEYYESEYKIFEEAVKAQLNQ